MRYFAFLTLYFDKIHMEKMFKNQLHMCSVFIKLLLWKQHLFDIRAVFSLSYFSLSFLELSPCEISETLSACQNQHKVKLNEKNAELQSWISRYCAICSTRYNGGGFDASCLLSKLKWRRTHAQDDRLTCVNSFERLPNFFLLLAWLNWPQDTL